MKDTAKWRDSICGNRPRARFLVLTLAVMLAAIISIPLSAYAQTYSVLHTFTDYPDDGAHPAGTLFLTSRRGKPGAVLHGTTSMGGSFQRGTVYRLNASAEYKVHSLAPDGQFDGYGPEAGLIGDGSGNFYGTTDGSLDGYAGTVFKMDKSGVFTYLHGFTGEDGEGPSEKLVRDDAGNLYGTTRNGGDLTCNAPYGCGVVFRVDAAGNYSLLHAFEGSDGNLPIGAMVLDGAGNLYGTTCLGGAHEQGTIFKLDSTGNLTVLHTFSVSSGIYPYAGLFRDAKGNLYGTASNGGKFGYGNIFKLTLTGKYMQKYSFTGGADGSTPSEIIRDARGNFYGTTYYGGDLACSAGGSVGCGVVFKLDATGTLTVLHTFEATDGAYPRGGVARDSAGSLYGTTYYGGDLDCGFGNGCGVVYKIAP